MSTAREEATATVLQDGRVLVAGGFDTGFTSPLTTVEIYDPLTETWAAAASMTQPRFGAPAALLPDGRVLVAGGASQSPTFYPRTAEVYDPSADTWTATGTMSAAHVHATATTLPTGKVLVTGGCAEETICTAVAELYDPATNAWTSAGNMSTPRGYQSATPLASGKILIDGGLGGACPSACTSLASAELYDPSTNGWSPAGTMGTPRSEGFAVRLSSGRVLAMGGSSTFTGVSPAPSTKKTDLYDPSSNSWSTGPPMQVARSNASAALLPDGSVLVAGGATEASDATFIGNLGHGAPTIPDVETYSPQTQTWTVQPQMQTDRELATTSVLVDGRVVIAGGGSFDSSRGTDVPTGLAETYTTPTPGTSDADPMNEGRDSHVAIRLRDGRVLVTGGFTTNSSHSATAEIYDPGSNTWSAAAPMNEGRADFCAVRLKDGQVMAIGGFGGTDSPPNIGLLASAEVYDPDSDVWTEVAPMATARQDFTATVLANGKVLVAGGADGQGNPIGSAELYDPATNTWSPAGALATPRYFDDAALLPTGKVLVLGGRSTLNVGLASTELYDPASNSWSAGANMLSVRLSPLATALPDGRILVAGGWVSSFSGNLSSAELYDPATDTWSDAGSMSAARLLHFGAVLPGGDVVVAGGADNHGNVYASADLYVPAQNQWYPAPALRAQRASATATALDDGRVLIAGGGGSSAFLASSELYPAPTPISMSDNFFTPPTAAAQRGWPVLWHDAQGTHTVTDSANLGESGGLPAPLFDSGLLSPKQEFSYVFFAAGSYAYHSSAGEPVAMKGKVSVPIGVRNEPGTRSIFLTWSSADLAGFVYDVQYRVAPVGSSNFGPWTSWAAPGGGTDWAYRAARFPVPASGTYQFRARLKNADTGKHSGWSPPTGITIR